MNKIRRNDFCVCGSQKKYKHCCLAKFNAFTAQGASPEFIERGKKKHPRGIVAESKTGFKLSEIIIDLAQEWLSICRTSKGEENAIIHTLNAWNLSLLDEKTRNQFFEDFFKEYSLRGGSKAASTIVFIMRKVIMKKQMHFPAINYPIIDYEITHTGHGPHLQVMFVAEPTNDWKPMFPVA